MIGTADLELFSFADDPRTAFKFLQEAIEIDAADQTPAFAQSRCRVTP
ncbi:MAG TPA: hypothetical protein VHU43_06145 [Steroidobacteraceae bacterium]|nr:hypothetical protein [Steroidobacteraceae bacterium]